MIKNFTKIFVDGNNTGTKLSKNKIINQPALHRDLGLVEIEESIFRSDGIIGQDIQVKRDNQSHDAFGKDLIRNPSIKEISRWKLGEGDSLIWGLRRLRTKWNREASEDLRNVHGIASEEELTEMIAKAMNSDLDHYALDA